MRRRLEGKTSASFSPSLFSAGLLRGRAKMEVAQGVGWYQTRGQRRCGEDMHVAIWAEIHSLQVRSHYPLGTGQWL